REDNNIWIGWPGMEAEDPEQQNYIADKLRGQSLVPVFLTQEEIERYYEGFSNEVLWPIFHYLPTYAQYDYQNWQMYKRVNQKFADVALQYMEAGDVLWIQDYQLLL